MDDLISRQAAISHVDDVPYIKEHPNVGLLWKAWIESLPSAQPELIEQGAYVRGFEQGRTQGMIDNTIKAEWTNADALDLQPTCNQLATDCISRQPKHTQERTETHACDCISRQAVTDTVRKIILGFFSDKDGAMTDTEKTLLSVNKAVCDGVRELPSTQQDCTECEEYDHERHYCQKYCDVIRRTLEEAQPERKTGRWIPCSKKLPEEDVDVLISYRYKEGEGDTSHTYIDITTYGQMYFGGNKVGNYKHWRAPFEYFVSNYEVIAWMPLPEPYQEGEGC